jgi:Ca2+-binding EF-hand superfamily protein
VQKAHNKLLCIIFNLQKHDVNKDGFIGPEEITNVLVELGYKHLTKEKVKGIVESLDTDKNGKLDFNELRALVQS